MRILLVLVLLGVAAFSVFGFLATYEPLERSTQLTWRIVYGTTLAASVAGVAWTLLRGKRSG